ncbi:Alpha carbonic anhydrase 7 [Forsythia ovata]|uniref:Alpha carbonic anhydrase 7 n=1 Tax=Forsythia ovata TaxID=205694 RepID=A0ABD1TNK4_9LAMI
MTSQFKCTYILSSILALLFLFGAKSVIAKEVEDDREFDYIKGSPKGPEKWGELKPEWAACKNGKMQSPIDLSNARVKFISQPEIRNYKPSNATLKNTGFEISVNWNNDTGSIFINGTEYLLQQVHWHTPSEHTINGKRYDMELYMVHESFDLNVQNRTTVIGVLYKIDRPDEFLSKLNKSISSLIGKKGEERELGIIDPNVIQAESQSYYRYMGSLTTPPCNEGVIWSVNTKVKNVSRDQIKLLKEAVLYYAEENARPLQPRNNRDIYQYFLKYPTSY